jgi:hypothetical protein
MVLLDNVGNILAMSNTLTLTSAMYNTFQTFTFSPGLTISPGDYYIGVAQPANASVGYFPYGSLSTVFVPQNLFYTSSLGGGSINPLLQNVGMIFLEAIFAGTCGPTGIDGISYENKLNVYPNPTSDKIKIKLGSVSDKAYAEVYNSIGQLVKHAVPVIGTEAEISVSDLSKGVYVIRITNGNEVSNVKIVVDK